MWHNYFGIRKTVNSPKIHFCKIKHFYFGHSLLFITYMSLQYMCMNWVWICVSAVFKCRESFKSVAVANSIASVWSVRDVFAGLSLSQSFIQPAVNFFILSDCWLLDCCLRGWSMFKFRLNEKLLQNYNIIVQQTSLSFKLFMLTKNCTKKKNFLRKICHESKKTAKDWFIIENDLEL